MISLLKLAVGTVVVVGSYFLFGNNANASPNLPKPPPPTPDPPPSPKDGPIDPVSAELKQAKQAEELGAFDGYNAGYADGLSGSPHNPNPQPPSSYTQGQRLIYGTTFNAYYSSGFAKGRDDGKAQAETNYKKAVASAQSKGQNDGLAAGRNDRPSGNYNPNPIAPAGWSSEMGEIYRSWFMQGYSQGFNGG